MNILMDLEGSALLPLLEKMWSLSAAKIRAIDQAFDTSNGAPVFTVAGKYYTRGWTEWTQGFQFGAAILQYDATGETAFLEMGRKATREKMPPHVGHFGVHDHGFNNVSTYGNLLRLMKEGKIAYNDWEKEYYEVALKLSGAVQARRFTPLPEGGYLYSFNGPHSLFVDTIRTVRALMVSHQLGFAIWSDNDVKINLLERGIQHCLATAKYAVYYGEGRDAYDEKGRTAHESIFNINDGRYRCPNSQQGFSGFTTWTRGLAWAMLGFPEQLEFLETLSDETLKPFGGRKYLEKVYLKAAKATCDFFIKYTTTDGIPYWDTGAPQLHRLGNYTKKISDPFNDFEPVDSSAAAIGAQGLLRLGHYLRSKNQQKDGDKYWQAGLTAMQTLLQEPYLSMDENHQGLLLHSIYHRPNGWDYIAPGQKIPNGESSMWGDYHLREAALYLQRIVKKEPYYAFFDAGK